VPGKGGLSAGRSAAKSWGVTPDVTSFLP
jgi:hypothetical protein